MAAQSEPRPRISVLSLTVNIPIIIQRITGNTITNSTISAGTGAPAAPAAALLPADNVPQQLCYQPRAHLERQLQDRLTSAANKDHLVVIHGPGGAGKSSLACQWATSLRFGPHESAFRIRIRAETPDKMREDWTTVAVQLGLSAKGKSLFDLASLVNQHLVAKFDAGVVVFDNVASYRDAFNSVRAESVGQVITKFFPRSALSGTGRAPAKVFFKIITTRDEHDWQKDKLVRVGALERGEALALFTRIADRRGADVDPTVLLPFLERQLGCSPLAVCQAAGYLRNQPDVTIAEYIATFTVAHLTVSSSPLPPECLFDGLSDVERQAVLTTFDIHLASLAAQNAAFPRVLEHASFMQSDSIGRQPLFAVSALADVTLGAVEQQRQFLGTMRTSSLMESYKSGEYEWITLHRIFQSVVLFRMPAASRPAVLRRLLQYCAANFLRDRSSFCNFTYLLRQIHARHEFFNAIQASDPEVIAGLSKVATQYVVNNEIERALETLGEALEHAAAAPQAVRGAIEQQLVDTVARLNLLAVDPSAWILTVLLRLSTDSSRRLLQSILNTLWRHVREAFNASLRGKLAVIEPVHNITVALFLRPRATDAHKSSGRQLLQRLCKYCQSALAWLEPKIADYSSQASLIRASIQSHGGRATGKQSSALARLEDGIAAYGTLSQHYDFELHRLEPWADVAAATSSQRSTTARRHPSAHSHPARSRPY